MLGPLKKTVGVDRKNQKALALLYLALEPLPNATNSSDVPIEFAAEHRHKDELEGKFRNSNFSPSIKKAVEYSFNFCFHL